MMAMIDDDLEDLESSRWSVDFTETRPLLAAGEHRERTKHKIWANVTALVVAMGIFSLGLSPIDDLQSSLNAAGGLGIKYGAMILANLLANTFLIHKLGFKWALVGGALFYCLYVVANFHPIWASLGPLTVVAGMGGALMWTTASSYLAVMAVNYAELTGEHSDKMHTLFFSTMNAAGYTSATLGGLVSFLILGNGFSIGKDFPLNSYEICGSNYCNEEVFTDDPDPDFPLNHGLQMVGIYGLCGFCLGITLFAVVMIVALVDPLSTLEIVEQKETNDTSCCGLLLATVRLWRNPKLLLLVPMSMVYGFQEAFWRVEFSKAYITCVLGVHYIGFMMIFFNVTALISSFACAWLGTRIKRVVAFSVLASIDIAALVCMLYWHPSSDDLIVIIIFTGVSGITYGGLSTLLLAFYGIALSESPEAAYSNLYFWSFLGSALMYACSFNLCLKVKLLVVLGLVILGISGYIMTEVLLVSEEKHRMIMRATEYREIISKRMLVPAGF